MKEIVKIIFSGKITLIRILNIVTLGFAVNHLLNGEYRRALIQLIFFASFVILDLFLEINARKEEGEDDE